MDYEYDQIVLKIRKIDRKYLKKCSLYLAIKEIQMKTTLIFNLISFELLSEESKKLFKQHNLFLLPLVVIHAFYGGHSYVLGCHPAFRLPWNRKVF